MFGTSKGRFIYSMFLPLLSLSDLPPKSRMSKSYSEVLLAVITKELFQVPELSSTNDIHDAKHNVTMGRGWRRR
jgi:hypothetical protein